MRTLVCIWRIAVLVAALALIVGGLAAFALSIWTGGLWIVVSIVVARRLSALDEDMRRLAQEDEHHVRVAR